MINTAIHKSCQEGVEFEIDIIKQLIVKNELFEGWGKWQHRTAAYTNVTLLDKKVRLVAQSVT
ncbi:MAG: hypothetical protein ACEY3C_05695 [Candidatus Tisiphia sp.]